MPCTSDYMEPNLYEQEIARTAKLLIFVKKKLDLKVDKLEKEYSDAYKYPTKEVGDIIVAELCGILTKLPKKKQEEIIYNAKSKDSRDLANWWEEHQEADRKRVAEEKKQKKEKALREKALSKLTPAERKALGL